jgi:UDP-glucose 4,6-dehydratase
MKKMITLIGHGYVGEHIAKELFKAGLNYHWIHHTDLIPLDTEFIINAAGYTGSPNVDACEIYRQECIDGNVIWPLALERSNNQTPIIHISSGCIYSGYPLGGYTEEDEPNFTFNTGSFYSGSKALGQMVLSPYMDKSYLFRIRMPFGRTRHPKNFLTKMETYKKLISFDNSLTLVDDVGRVCVHFYLTRPQAGIYNVCNPGKSNAKEISAMMKLEKEWFTIEEFKTATKAPRSNCILSTKKLESVFDIKPIHETLYEVIAEYK